MDTDLFVLVRSLVVHPSGTHKISAIFILSVSIRVHPWLEKSLRASQTETQKAIDSAWPIVSSSYNTGTNHEKEIC